MITKIITAKGGEFEVGTDGLLRPVETHYGLSSDTKPTDGVRNAERYLEMDTGKLFLYDADNEEWLPWKN